MDKVTGQCPQTTTFLKRKESRSGIEPRSFRLPAYRLTARPNRLTNLGARLLPQSYQYPNLSEGADRVGGQLRGDKECPFSGVTRSDRVWRRVPESDAPSLGLALICIIIQTHKKVRTKHAM